MKKEIITTLNAPAPIGPYNQAIKVGNTLYVSGQIPINAKTMEIFNGTIKEETELVMLNLNAVLEAASMSFEHVVKTTIFLSDMENFGKVNNVYGTYFDNDTAPARETVAVKTLPKNVRIEISMIAVK
ncbi:MAG: RidA family protein [Flavobacteriaceae bacterium]|jgi:2-iminobutanoate/2-iminopropanoate deaminase|nr:RidA family protein [Flavobacteriaceae bacterium]MDA9630618.1 RidA family protein [Flavobacteriaceae bacterium]MDA9642866.1 RidA family protein [bacterium]|tara:strand:+ start:94 stop:477 length:384 start_codon:yes stop_codon:yes gene_type:complete